MDTLGASPWFPGRPLSDLIHLIAYDGNPGTAIWNAVSGRAFWDSSDAPSYETRARVPLGSHAGDIAKHYGLKHVEPRLAFGFMINYLEAEGVSAKGDRMCSISDMCSGRGRVVSQSPV